MSVSKISWLLPPSKLKLSINDVHIWRVKLTQADRRVQQLQQILSDDERLRAERFHFDRDRSRYIVSQGTLRLIIGDYVDMEPSRLQFHAGHRGKPYLMHSLSNVPLQFNLAHSKAIGNGLYHALDRFDVSLAPGEPARLVSVEGSAEQASCWFMKSLTPEDGYVAALAVKGSDFCPSYWKYPEN
jgi:phosphopantetheinyl transferase